MNLLSSFFFSASYLPGKNTVPASLYSGAK